MSWRPRRNESAAASLRDRSGVATVYRDTTVKCRNAAAAASQRGHGGVTSRRAIKMIRVLSLAAAGAGADRCVFPTEARAPLQASVVAGAARPSARRGSIEANHKTGTYLAACLARVVKNNVQLHSMHTSGNYVAGKRYLVLTRDPFVLVDSAYRYHKRGVEAWTKPRQPGNRDHTSQGHAEAFRDYSRLREACAPTLPALEDESYFRAARTLRR